MAQRKRNAGLYSSDGFLDIQMEGSPDLGNIAFSVKINAHSTTRKHRPISRRGRASAGLPKWRLGDLTGGFTFSGEVRFSDYPFPAGTQYATGTLVRQLDTANKISCPVRITDLQFSHVEEGKDASEIWKVTGSGVLDGAETLTWKGTQRTFTAPGANVAETFVGLGKSYDQRGLTTTATQRIDCEVVDNTDAAEVALVVARIAAAVTPPISNLKVVSAGFQRDEDDSNGGVVTLSWGLQDSKDSQETPRNTQHVDPQDLTSSRGLAQVFTTGSPPSTPSAPSGQKLTGYTDIKLNDQLSVRVWEFGRQDSKDQQETPRNIQSVDGNSISDTRQLAQVFTTGSPPATPAAPSGLKLVDYTDTKLDDTYSVRVWRYARQDSKDAIETPEDVYKQDGNSIDDVKTVAALFTTGTPPADPTPPDGLKIVTFTDHRVNDLLSYRVWIMARQDSKDAIETPRNSQKTDGNGITDARELATVFETGSPPSTPAAPSGLKIVDYEDRKINDLLSVRVWRYARQDSKDAIETPENVYRQDPNGLDDLKTLAVLFTTASPPADPSIPSGLKIVTKTDHKVNDVKSFRVYVMARQDSLDQIETPENRYTFDSYGLTDAWTRAKVYDSGGSAPATPADTPPANLKPFDIQDKKLTDGLSVRVWVYRPSDAQDELTQSGTVSTRSSIHNNTDIEIALVSSTDDAATLADTYGAGFISQVNADSVSARKINPNVGEITYRFVDPGIQLKGNTFGSINRIVKARYSASNVQLYVASNVSRGTGKRVISLSKMFVQSSVVREFSIARSFATTSVPDFSSLLGKTNSASFLGLAAGSVFFYDARYLADISISGTRNFQMEYFFRFDALGFFDEIPDELFDVPLTVTSSATGTGWVNASTLGLATTPAILSTGDYSGFVT